MSILYLLNFRDPELREISWNVLSRSIVTFLGVLVGAAWNDVLLHYIVGSGAPASKTIAVQFCSMLGWYLLLQLVLAKVSGAIGTPPASVRDMVLDLKCWVTLLGITTGRSMKDLLGYIQQQVPRDFIHTAGMIPLAGLGLFFVFKVHEYGRMQVALADDGQVDVYELLWERYTTQTEDNATCMALAHVVVQVVRFQITGHLPPANGSVSASESDTGMRSAMLFLSSLAFVALIVVLDVAITREIRFVEWLKAISGNCVAFCLLYAILWCILDYSDARGAVGSMLLAVGVSFVSFLIMFILHFLERLDCTGPRADMEIHRMLQPLAILIGFAWKFAFDASIKAITSHEHVLPVPVMDLTIALLLALLVVPAWRLYILPVILKNEVSKTVKQITEDYGGHNGPHIFGRAQKRAQTHDGVTRPLLSTGPVEPSNGLTSEEVTPHLGLNPEEADTELKRLRQRCAELQRAVDDLRKEQVRAEEETPTKSGGVGRPMPSASAEDEDKARVGAMLLRLGLARAPP
uniref:Uncharacterized protein n=1 Tax=Pyrodinium bahamense TaxID=73915 RepID=A0A7S0AJG9_9DINO